MIINVKHSYINESFYREVEEPDEDVDMKAKVDLSSYTHVMTIETEKEISLRKFDERRLKAFLDLCLRRLHPDAYTDVTLIELEQSYSDGTLYQNSVTFGNMSRVRVSVYFNDTHLYFNRFMEVVKNAIDLIDGMCTYDRVRYVNLIVDIDGVSFEVRYNENISTVMLTYKSELSFIYLDDSLIYITEDDYVMKYNGPVTLSPKSKKPILEFEVGDVLCANLQGELMSEDFSQEDIIDIPFPIAVCVSAYGELKEGIASFMSIYMLTCNIGKVSSVVNHDCYIQFGYDISRYGFNLGRMCGDEVYSAAIKEINNRFSKMKDEDKQKVLDCMTDGICLTREVNGYFPLPFLCSNFHTNGTRKGDWYIPSYEQFTSILDVDAINDARLKYNFKKIDTTEFIHTMSQSYTMQETLRYDLNDERKSMNKLEPSIAIPFIDVK